MAAAHKIGKRGRRNARQITLVPFWRIGNRIQARVSFTLPPRRDDDMSDAMVLAYLDIKQNLMESGVDVDELDENFRTACHEIKTEASRRRLLKAEASRRRLKLKSRTQTPGDSRWDNIV